MPRTRKTGTGAALSGRITATNARRACGRSTLAPPGQPGSSDRATFSAEAAVQPNGEVNWLVVRGAAHNNLKKIDVSFPLGRFTCVTGVSGSGKSSLVNDILYAALARELNNATTLVPGRYSRIDGLGHLDKVIAIDQSPIGRTPRSNPGTYIKVFDEIRSLFTKLPDAKLRGYKPGRFSFNVPAQRGGGRCEACAGNGSNRIEMDFLADVWVTCPVCGGQRFNRETLQVLYKGKSIADVLEMDVQQAMTHFENVPRIREMLQTLHDVGLDYIKIGQSSTTLSGGEAQRIKLARELVKKATGRTLYVLDEPTTGLHFDDIRKLLGVLHGFVDAGNTVVVIEHNLDVIKTADWIIDLGPEGGEQGGWIVAEGTPEEVAACQASFTGQALREVLSSGNGLSKRGKDRRSAAPSHLPSFSLSDACDGEATAASGLTTDAITVAGARQHNLKDLDVSFTRERITVCTGVSGSGKTSFAIDTVFTEGYRRYVESLSAYARQFLGQMAKPRVDHVHGLSPAICIEQKAASKSPRSTVGTITEIYDYMRVLWARIGTPYCPRCQVPIGSQTVDEIVARVMALEPGAPIMILAPVALGDGESYATMFNRLKNSGYTRVRIDGQTMLTSHAGMLDARRKHRVEVVVDRTTVRARARGRIAESIEHALALGNGLVVVVKEAVETVREERDRGIEGSRDQETDGEAPARQSEPGESAPEAPAGVPLLESAASSSAAPDAAVNTSESGDEAPDSALITVNTPAREFMFSQKLACMRCGTSYTELGPNQFSFNSQLGWCETCEGLGVQRGAPAAEIIKHPNRSVFNGAIAGWGRVNPKTPFGKMLGALCDHLGIARDAPLTKWTAEQRRILLFGSPEGQWVDGGRAYDGLRFRWRGLFPTIDAATRNSWMLRYRLQNVVTDIPCVACHGGRLRPDAAAVRLGPHADEGAQTDDQYPPRQGDQHSAEARAGGRTIVEVCELPLTEAARFFETLERELDAHRRRIAGEVLKEIRNRLQFLLDVGLEYLTLHRAAPTLSGGEAQRIRLASQIGSGLSGVLYVLDEPTIGLHPRDNLRLIRALQKLRDLGNTLLMVEHDREVIRHADRLLDFGPRAGAAGGHIVAQGTPADFLTPSAQNIPSVPSAGVPCPSSKRGHASVNTPQPQQNASAPPDANQFHESLTRAYLSGQCAIPVPTNRRPVKIELARPKADGPHHVQKTRRKSNTMGTAPASTQAGSVLLVRGARQNNLKNIDVPIPLGRFTCVTGVSGSGKSSLVNDILWPALAIKLQRATMTAGEHDEIEGVENLDKVINVDQSPIGSTPSSNPATYTGAFDWIRELFARLPDSKVRGYNANRFSFNRPGGRCEACEGYGQKCIEMHFMADVWVDCETCHGRRYNPETLEVKFKGKSIADVLEMRVAEALELFANVPKVRRMLQTLADVGLDYVQLGQPAPTLSGGEAQRVKLAAELGKPDTGRTFYILDEPTTGLHFDDVRKLLSVIHRLVDLGNTVLVVEHNLDVIKCADWIIDLGPEAGEGGGWIVAMGTPEEVARKSELSSQNSVRGRKSAALSKRGKQPLGRETRNFLLPPSDFVCHTAAALAPVLALGPYEPRTPYDPKAHARREMEVAKAGFGRLGREARLPWQIDGRKWHLEQRTSREGKPKHWEAAALEYVIDLVQENGGFAPTNWNERASVEITADGAENWFLHALTGDEWLLQLCFLVPPGTFERRALERQLGLKTLDERGDLETYGDWSRVDIRPRLRGGEAVVIYVHDKQEIDTPGFRKFIRDAARAYLESQRRGGPKQK